MPIKKYTKNLIHHFTLGHTVITKPTILITATTILLLHFVNGSPLWENKNDINRGNISELQTTVQQLDHLIERVYVIEDEIETLHKFIKNVLGSDQMDLNLLMIGENVIPCNETGCDALSMVRNYVQNELRLKNIGQHIINAEFTSNGILFQAGSRIDKKMILLRIRNRSKTEGIERIINYTQ